MKSKQTLLPMLLITTCLTQQANADMFFDLGQKIGSAIGNSVTNMIAGNDTEDSGSKSEKAQEGKTYPLPTFSKTLSVKNPKKIGDITVDSIKADELTKEVQLYLAANSKYAHLKFETSKNLIFDMWTTPYLSVTSDSNPTQINVLYKKLEKTRTQTLGGTWNDSVSAATTFEVPINYETIQDPSGFALTFKTSSVAKLNNEKKVIDTPDKLIADVMGNLNTILEKIQDKKVNRYAVLKGEINTEYNDASTYANFERILGFYQWGNDKKPTNTDISKEKYFSYKLPNNEIIPLHIKVYPYKNGSKVVYDMEVKYSLALNGNVDLTTNDLDSIKTNILKIAND